MVECESNFLFYLIVIPFRCIARDEFNLESGEEQLCTYNHSRE